LLKTCPICGLAKDERLFYRTSSYCRQCHNQRSLLYRKQPHRREKERAAKRAWLKQHPEVNRRNVAAYRARRKMASFAQSIPDDRVLVEEAVVQLGVTKQRIQQLIDGGRLRAMRIRGRWLIDQADLDRMIEERELSRDHSQDSLDEEE
jgi:excisionase family DNA binding protein